MNLIACLYVFVLAFEFFEFKTTSGITENGLSSSYEIDFDYDLYYGSYYSGSFIQSLSYNGVVYNCLSYCNADSLCSLFVVKAGICYFYKKLNRVYVKSSTGTKIYSRRISGASENSVYIINPSSFTTGLIHYWPFWGDGIELINQKHATYGANAAFSNGRFGSSRPALDLTYGYYIAPPSNYFYGDFTVTAWVYYKQLQIADRLIDFGNGADSNNVLIALTQDQSKVSLHVYNNGVGCYTHANSAPSEGQWQFVSVTLYGNQAIFYINGAYIGEGYMITPNNVVRTSNYIGKSNWANPVVNAIFEELKIFNRALSQSEIQAEMNK